MRKLVYFVFALFLANTALAQTVEFQCDMSVKAKKGEFIIGTDTLSVAGSFNNWTPKTDLLTGPGTDSVYKLTKTFNVGDTLMFKFVKNSTGWEQNPDRQYIVPAGNSVYFAYFDRDSIYSVPKAIAITFSCNMEFERVSGRFNPAQDTLTARGSFNGWTSDDIMTVSGTDPNIYEVTVSDTLGVGETLNYKFAYGSFGVTTWENDPNKTYTITQQDYDLGLAFTQRTFNDLTITSVTNYPCSIKFVVDMNGAVSSVTGQPFPSIDRVCIAGANAPLKWPAGGWPNSDSGLVHFMFDDGTNGDSAAGDLRFTKILVFPQYSPFRIQYKYGANWGLPSNTGSNDNESGVGTDHFITLEARMLSATVWNKWSVMGDHSLVQIVLDVKEIGTGVPESYSLEQNYPNPFNPTTNIRFSITDPGLVTLKVYNSLGQEVATLLNEEKNAGTYEVNFSANNFSSGIYFYKIMSNNFTATKKMILVK